MHSLIEKIFQKFAIFNRDSGNVEHDFKDKLIEEVGKVQRDTRRINLASGQQIEKIESIQEVVEELKHDLSMLHARLDRETDVMFSESDLLHVLDELDTLGTVVRFNSSIRKRVTAISERLLETAKWSKVAELGEPYHPKFSTIAAIVTPETNEQCSCFAIGSVFDIVRQGYVRANGELVREATVIAVSDAGKRASAVNEDDAHQINPTLI